MTTPRNIKPHQLSLDTDGTLSANSDLLISTQKAIKTYIDTQSFLNLTDTPNFYSGNDGLIPIVNIDEISFTDTFVVNMIFPDNIKLYFGSDNDSFIQFNTSGDFTDITSDTIYMHTSDWVDYMGYDIATHAFILRGNTYVGLQSDDGHIQINVDKSNGAVGIISETTGISDRNQVLIDKTFGALFNAGGYNFDFQIKSLNDINIFYVDGGNDNIGIGTNTPNTSAKLEIAGSLALLIPRLNTTQINALTPTNGMIIYNTSTNKFQGRENGSWVNLI